MQSSEPFLSSSELEEVALVENWYFLFAVMGTLQLSRYLSNRNGFDQRGAHFTHTHTHDLSTAHPSWTQTPNLT